MFILNNKRINPYAPYTDSNGTRYANLTDPAIREQLGITEIPDPTPPEDYTEETYYRTEQDDAPYVVYTKKSDEQIQQVMLSKFITALEGYYDKVAQVKQYDSRFTCALRAGYPGPFQSEGQSFALWMDQCNAYGYTQMALVLSGERPMPTIETLIGELPVPPWELPIETDPNSD